MTVGASTPDTTWRVLLAGVDEWGNREAVVDGSERLTYGGLAAAVREAGAAMAAAGVRTGDRIALWAPNSARWAVVAFGAHSIGAIVVPINTRARGAEAAYQLRKTASRILFVDDGFLGTGYAALLRGVAGEGDSHGPVRGLPALDMIVDFHREPDVHITSWTQFVGAPECVSTEVRAPAADDVAYIMSTSGSTGIPKGVVLRHGQVVRTYRALAQRLRIGATDRLLGVTPLSHSFGLNAGLLAALLSGGCYVAVDAYEPAAALERIHAERITVLSGPPTLFTDLIGAAPRTGQRPDWAPRLAVTGAATVTARLLEQIRASLGVESIATGYGLTEACGTVTASHPAAGNDSLSAPPLPGVELAVVDPAGEGVGAGEPGEVLVRGFNVMSGYFEEPTSTAAAVDPAGWLHTGDIGILDTAGALRIIDRLGDMFIVGGFNVYPSEVEHVLGAHPAVSEVAVLGIPDERLGERGIAYVVAVPDQVVSDIDLIAYCRARLAGYKVPAEVVRLTAMPRIAAGKPSRRDLRALALRRYSD